ncbi:putative Pisatin demethylase [Glarea lozoyensis 74030]|nr:putative Pisatin demethylase [Glarea lozoyensis 74030]
MVMPSDKDEMGPGKLLRNIKNVVNERYGNKIQKRDMLGSFIRHGLTKSELVSETSLQIIAGSDTTAATIRATLLYIVSNPRVYNKLRLEIDSTLTTGNIIPSSIARELPYLQAVIKEGIRMWPGGSLPVPKVVPPGGDTFNGIFLPGGTEIGNDIWGMQHSKTIYGYDANRFRPERWLENSGEYLLKMESTMGLVFGTGKYGCLGKNIALMELDKIFFELLKNFEFQLINPDKPWESKNYGMWFQSNMLLSVADRIL